MNDKIESTDISAHELRQKLAKRESVVLFDVRPREDYERWNIDSAEEQVKINVPYRELVAQGGKSNPIESIQSAIERDLSGELSSDREIVTVCAKGISSRDITKALHNLGYNARTLRDGMDAWSHLYHFQPVVESDRLSLYQVSRPARGCLSYVIMAGGKAIVVDPLRHIDKYTDFLTEKRVSLVRVLDTHGHADHISGGPALAERMGVPYFLHPYDGIHPIDVLPAEINFEYLRDAMTFSLGDVHIEAIHIPGHTLGNVAFLIDHKYLLTGDSIFIDSIARPDLGGHGETWAPIHYRSLKRLMELPDETQVLPGHFSSTREANNQHLYAASMGELKKRNPGLLKVQEGEESFVNYILESLPDFPQQYIDIKRVNAGLMTPHESKASELELGRNICALSQTYEH